MSLIILANVIFGDEDKMRMVNKEVIQKGSYIRTATSGQKSIWGDVLLQVDDIRVDGRFKALRTVWLCKIVTGGDVYEVLDKVV